nr:MAG TPA: hypothetical protein [Caudoviricetes sp.]
MAWLRGSAGRRGVKKTCRWHVFSLRSRRLCRRSIHLDLQCTYSETTPRSRLTPCQLPLRRGSFENVVSGLRRAGVARPALDILLFSFFCRASRTQVGCPAESGNKSDNDSLGVSGKSPETNERRGHHEQGQRLCR